MSRLREYHALMLAAFLFGPLALLAPLGLAPLFVLSALLVVVFAKCGQGNWPPLNKRFLVIAGCFVAWGAASSLWAPEPRETLWQSLVLAIVFLCTIILVSSARRVTGNERKKLVKALIAGAAIIGALALFELISNGIIAKAFKEVLVEVYPFGVYNRTASIMSLFIWPILLTIEEKRLKTIGVAIFIITYTILSFFYNDTSLYALTLGTAIFFLVLVSPKPLLYFLAAIVVVGVCVAPVLPRTILSPEYVKKVTATVPSSLKHRFIIWEFTADKIFEHPLRGWGLNSARSLPHSAEKNKDDLPYMPLHPHNGILQIWLEMGLLGAVYMIGLFIFVMRSISRSKTTKIQKALCLGASASALSIFSLSYGIWQGWWMATLVLLGVFLIFLVTPKEQGQGR